MASALKLALEELEDIKEDLKRAFKKVERYRLELVLKKEHAALEKGKGSAKRNIAQDMCSLVQSPLTSTPIKQMSESVSTNNWSFEYSQDPDYSGPAYPSLPMHSKGGISYIPPGWKRTYKNIKVTEKPEVKTPNIDELFE